MTPEELNDVEHLYTAMVGRGSVLDLCAALRAAWRERDALDKVAASVSIMSVKTEYDRDAWKARAEMAEKRAEAMEEAIAAEQLAKHDLVRVTGERDEAIAAAAVLRAALEACDNHARGCSVLAKTALASDAGKPLLEWAREAAESLDEFGIHDHSEWGRKFMDRARALGLLPEDKK